MDKLGPFELGRVRVGDCLEAAAKGVTLAEYREGQEVLFAD